MRIYVLCILYAPIQFYVMVLDPDLNPHDHVVYVNICFCRLIHAFTCADILPSQYMHFSKFATLGVVGKWGIQSSELL